MLPVLHNVESHPVARLGNKADTFTALGGHLLKVRLEGAQMNSIYGKRGRPSGSKTKADTPGKKRAREYFDFRIEMDLRPTEAAKVVAEKHSVEKYGVETSQIFKDAKRHEASITREAWAEADLARRNYEEMLATTIGPNMPTDARQIVDWIIVTKLRNQRM